MTDNQVRSSETPGDNVAARVLKTSRMSFGDHLDELRTRIIRGLIGVVIGTIFSLVFGREILEIIYRPLLKVQYANGLSPGLQALSPTAAFSSYLKIGILSGLIITMPWVLYQVWRFVTPGLYRQERRFVRLLIPTSLGLFVLGVLFLYAIVLPIVLQFFISFNNAFGTPDLTPTAFQKLLLPSPQPQSPATNVSEPMQLPILQEDPPDPKSGDVWVNKLRRRLVVKTDSGVLSIPLEPGAVSTPMQSQFAIDFYVSFVLMLALAFGIAFETPIVVFFLAWSGIVTRAAMVRSRRYVLLGVVMAAAILTPPDPLSQMLLAVPMYVLFELGLLAARLAKRPE